MQQRAEAPAISPIAPASEPAEEASMRTAAPVLTVLAGLSLAHLINDTLQSLIPAIYPILKRTLRLDYWHIGFITLTNQLTASILQPFIGFYTDRRPQPFALAAGMTFTLAGLILLA